MNVLNKMTIKNLKLNKKRTIVTIIGIMLSTALICGVAGLVSSFQNSLIEMMRQEKGNYHAGFYNVSKDKFKYLVNNEKIESCFYTSDVGWAYLPNSENEDKPYVNIVEYDKKALSQYGIKLTEGRMPESSNEILISEHIISNARVDLNIGDTIALDVGERRLKDGTTLNKNNPYLTGEPDENGGILEEEIANTTNKKYTIVGKMKRLDYSIENYSSPGYTVITYMEESKDFANIFVLYKHPKEYKMNNKLLEEVTECEDIDINNSLIRFQGGISDSTMQVLYGVASVVMGIIIVSSVFVIRNGFSISVAEKNKQYGMLSSVGATSKQIKKTVLLEGFFIGIIAVPLGILSGVIAIYILLEVVNYLLEDLLDGMRFIYSIPLSAIGISILISFITIYLSCLLPARKASKISPIVSIRGNNDIKIKAKKIRTSKLVKKIFGIGGIIASKNLKRSRKKYRTTVISIVISVVIFISLSSFLSYGTKSSGLYYKELKYNMYVRNGSEEMYKEISKFNDIDDYAYTYYMYAKMDFDKYETEIGKNYNDVMFDNGIMIIGYNNEYFKKYIKELGINEKNYQKAVILIDDIVIFNEDETKSFENIYNIKANDTIELEINEQKENITISKKTEKRPMGYENTYPMSGMMIVSEDFIKKRENVIINDLYIQTSNASSLENNINDFIKQNRSYKEAFVTNYEEMAKQENRMVLVISIFLYGFITVISLIGVTNIFNTITTNMILRSKEFAMLKSIGMTQKEFNKMIRLESILYGFKSLMIGVPIGILGSYLIYKSFSEGMKFTFEIPIVAILICIVFVFIIVGFTMKYSLKKINKQNIIDTIRNENI